MDKYQPVIGLEVHIELATKSKMFCSCSADYFGKEPNTHTCPICLGLPGAMPKVNIQAIEFTHMLGLALNCQIPLSSKFDRKNYFYPDLAKGFQISQYDLPFSQKGFIEIESTDSLQNHSNSTHTSGVSKDAVGHTPEVRQAQTKRIGITRAHLEEDTGKLAHATVDGKRVTLIDFNRSSVPLVEVVTDPDMSSSEEAKAYAQKLQQIARYLKISDADMEKGSMRIEPNVSLRPMRHPGVPQSGTIGSGLKRDSIAEFTPNNKILRSAQNDRREGLQNDKQLPPYKVELKNINSFKFAQAAIEYEIKRQSEILDRGEIPAQETRGWNEAKSETVSQRSKEFAHDYRYFPEPDLTPFKFNLTSINKIKSQLPELPDAKINRFQKEFGLSQYDSEILTRDSLLADYFEEAARAAKTVKLTAKQVANVIINKKPNIETTLPAELIGKIISQTKVSDISEDQLLKIIDSVLQENPKAEQDYKNGKQNALMFLVGQVMRKMESKLDANSVKSILEQKLKQ